MKPPLVQLDAVGAAVDLGTAGVGPAMAVIEAPGPLVAVEHPQAGGGEAASTETVERGGVQLSSDAAPPAVGIEVERVQVASVGSARSMGSKGARPRRSRRPLARLSPRRRSRGAPTPRACPTRTVHARPRTGRPGPRRASGRDRRHARTRRAWWRWRGRRPVSRPEARPCPDAGTEFETSADVNFLPLSTYSAQGALRQDPDRAAESPAEARTCGNQDARSRCAGGCAPPDGADQLAEKQPQ